MTCSLSEMLNDDLKILVAKTRIGDKVAYSQFLSMLAPYIRRAAGAQLTKTKHGHYVEDVTQEVLLTIHLKLHTYDDTYPFLSWMRVILWHKIIDFLRRQKTNVSSIEEMEFWEPSDDVNPEEVTVQYDVTRLLGRLKSPAGDIIHDMKINGLSVRELSVKYELSESNVKVTVHRGLKEISDYMRKENAA